MNVKITVIIPVYNSEKYLAKCLESIISQTYENIEIICIDDGSTDSSSRILSEYRFKDRRINIMSQHNQYAGVARNVGIKAATGKYIVFADSDDFFKEDAIEKIVFAAEEKQTEILIYDIIKYDNITENILSTAERTFRAEMFGEGVKSAEEIKDVIFMFAGTGPWNKCYLRSFLLANDLSFPSLRRMEDLPFVLSSLAFANKIGILNEKLYYYRMNIDTSLQGTIGATPEIFTESVLLLKKNLLERNLYEKYMDSYIELCLWITNYTISLMAYEPYMDLKNSLCNGLDKEIGIDKIIADKAQINRLISSICSKNKVLVYGAGMMAKCFVKYLIYVYGYSEDEIMLTVTSLDDNSKKIMGIPVIEFKDLKVNQDIKTVIAIENKKIRTIIKSNLLENGINDIDEVGYKEMLQLICVSQEAI